MITEAALEALGFNKITWNLVMPEYWLPLLEPTGDRTRDMNCRLGVVFNERVDDPGPKVQLVMGGIYYLPHIKEVDQLLRLYELLAGRSVVRRVGGEWRRAGPPGVEYEVGG